MSAISREQAAQVLYQAGFRGDDLAKMVAIAGRESGYQPAAHRTDQDRSKMVGDFGLLQINYTHFDGLRRAGIISSPQDLFNPAVNARAAFHLYKQSGLSPWAAGPGGFTGGGDPLYKTNYQAASVAVQNASRQGLLGADFNVDSTSGGAPMAAANNPAAAAGPFTLPPDAQLYNNGLALIAVFDVGGVKLGYAVNWWDGSVNTQDRQVTNVTPDQYNQLGVVDAGNAEELRGFGTEWPNYRAFWESTLDTVIGKNNPARTDPGVLAVIAKFAARPDMSSTEFNNLLQDTEWYRTRSTKELEWNGLADGEKQIRRDNLAAQMVQTWFEFTGEVVSSTDPRITNQLEDLASGKIAYGKWTEDNVKRAAADNPESPYARKTRDEQEEQRQRGVDIENTATRVKDLARKWGLNFSGGQYQDWAKQIAEKTMSEADVLEMFKDQSVVLFPWKNREMETTTAAMPWMQTYERIMEKSGDLFEPKVQAALTAGQPVWEFEQSLKKSGDWLQTKNARDEMFSVVSEAGKRMGFE